VLVEGRGTLGPHPGIAEGSIGKERTEDLAGVIGTFHQLRVAHTALEIEDEWYAYSWVER
jgi:homogentisate 1,2-dioxygenase